MDVELVINSFWFLTIITAALYIAKKRYIGKKEYNLLDRSFKICFIFSIVMIIIGFISLIIE
ncbi:MAG: hypothetical protein CM15mP70_08480 [Pelagibacteraceae bacterium]|jgi:hypothetical protein|nr:MAG: hypothetical protein CM15mP70_08480 [Pelagibacteraceae bacterium]|tara:strand:- start:281 stop:466 length:186 start_codon:yes stop_codon:yes gene_type:complete